MNIKSYALAALLAGPILAATVQGQTAEGPQLGPPRPAFVKEFPDEVKERISVGNFDNVAFALNLQQQSRKVSSLSGTPKTELVATYDYADCSKGQERLLEQPLKELKRGDSTWVD